MNPYDAAEIAFQNGYKKAATEIFEEIEDILSNIGYFDELDFRSLKKKYTA